MNLKELTEKELCTLKQDAIESQNGYLLKKIQQEQNRREKYDY